MTELTKRCSRCHGDGPFGKNCSRADGLDDYCKTCRQKSSKETYQRKREKKEVEAEKQKSVAPSAPRPPTDSTQKCTKCSARTPTPPHVMCDVCLGRQRAARALKKGDKAAADAARQCERSLTATSIWKASQSGSRPITMPFSDFVVWYAEELIRLDGTCPWCLGKWRVPVVYCNKESGTPRTLICGWCAEIAKRAGTEWGRERLERILSALKKEQI